MAGFAKGLLVGILFICLGGLGWLLIAQPHFTAARAQDLKNQFTKEVPGEDLSGDISLEEEMLDWKALQAQYPDIKGWLTIPGTCVDYPVLQSSAQDPEYYLRRNYNGKARMAGSLISIAAQLHFCSGQKSCKYGSVCRLPLRTDTQQCGYFVHA